MRLEFLHYLMAIIDECKTRGLAATVLSSESEAGDLIFVGFVELRKFLAEFVFGDVGAIGVENIAR